MPLDTASLRSSSLMPCHWNFLGSAASFTVCAMLLSGCPGASPKAASEPGFKYVEQFEVDKSGRLSAAVYDGDGRLVRELFRGEFAKPGRAVLRWDGLDREGNPVPDGEYEWRTLWTPGFQAEYVTSLGIRPGTKAYDSWVGNSSGGIFSVALDETGLYGAAEGTETAPVLLKVSPDGTERIWTKGRGDVTQGRFQGGASLASNGAGRLFMLQQNGYVQVIDSEQGEKLETWDVLDDGVEIDEKRGRDLLFAYSNKPYDGSPVDLDAWQGTVVMSYRDLNEVRWLDPGAEGAVLAKVEVAEPTGVGVVSENEVVVLSKGRLLSVNRDGTIEELAKGLTDQGRISVDRKSGNLFVALRNPRHQVLVFSKDGKLLDTFGREGGREDGIYLPENFFQLTGIAADGTGGFFVAEGGVGPRRMAHFDGNGKLVGEWYGGQPYYTWGEPDPRDPSMVWFNSGNWLTLAQIDYGTKKWKVVENYEQAKLADGLVRAMSGHTGRWRVLYKGDQRYLVAEGLPQILRHEEGNLQAVSVIGREKEIERARELAGFEERAIGFRWVDKNGDGLPQADEFTFITEGSIPNGRSIADDFSLVNLSLEQDEEELRSLLVQETRPRWEEDIPVYPVGTEEGIARRVAGTEISGSVTLGGTRGAGVYRDQDGNYFAFYNTKDEFHGLSWPTYWGKETRVVKWDSEGRELWKSGRHAVSGGFRKDKLENAQARPGELHVPAAFMGEVDGNVVIADRVEWMGQVWSKDGMFVGDLLDGRVEDGLPDTVYHWWRTLEGVEAIITSDNASGGAILQTADGEVLWFTQGRNNAPVYKVHGWDGWERQTGKFVVEGKLPHASGEGTGLQAEFFMDKAMESGPVETRVDPQVWHGIPQRQPGHHEVIDGPLNSPGPVVDWSPVEKVVLPGDKESEIRFGEPFAVRWRGQIEAPLSEEYIFSAYARGGVRLWVDGKQVIFGWNEGPDRYESTPVKLIGGQRYDVQLDFYTTNQHPSMSLNWESMNIDRQRIPQRFLFPEVSDPAPLAPAIRSAADRIAILSFDDSNIEPTGDARIYYTANRQRGISKSDAHLIFQNLDFGEGLSKLRIQASGKAAGGGVVPVTMALRLGGPDGKIVAEFELPGEASEGGFLVPLNESVSGIQNICLVNTIGPGWYTVTLGEFCFE